MSCYLPASSGGIKFLLIGLRELYYEFQEEYP